MVKMLKIDLREVNELGFRGSGGVLIKGDNSQLDISFHHTDFTCIIFTIMDTKLIEMIESDLVSDEVIIKIRKKNLKQNLPEEDFYFYDETEPTNLTVIDLRKVEELDFQNDGKILIVGDESRLILGFHDGEFVYIRYSIEDTELFEMTEYYATDKEVVINTQETQEGIRQRLADDGIYFDKEDAKYLKRE